MRITGGEFRGRALRLPKGAQIRPSSDRLRLALFNILGNDLSGSSFLDLFSGSGAVGLEALSRGAGPVVFVDEDRALCEGAAAQAAAFGADRTRFAALALPCARALERLAAEGQCFDRIFMDPPYGAPQGLDALRRLGGLVIMNPQGPRLVVFEHGSKEQPPRREGALALVRRRDYGAAALSFYGPEHGN